MLLTSCYVLGEEFDHTFRENQRQRSTGDSLWVIDVVEGLIPRKLQCKNETQAPRQLFFAHFLVA